MINFLRNKLISFSLVINSEWKALTQWRVDYCYDNVPNQTISTLGKILLIIIIERYFKGKTSILRGEAYNSLPIVQP